MKKGIIVYRSRYGATKKYADWIKEETGFDLVEMKNAVADEVMQYDTVIFCGGIYASGIAGLSFLRKNRRKQSESRIFVLCVGASPYDEKAFRELKEHNLKEDLKEIPVFYGRGAWDESAMTFIDRTMCGMLKKVVAKKDPASCEPWMKALLEASGKNCDWTDKSYLKPLFECMEND